MSIEKVRNELEVLLASNEGYVIKDVLFRRGDVPVGDFPKLKGSIFQRTDKEIRVRFKAPARLINNREVLQQWAKVYRAISNDLERTVSSFGIAVIQTTHPDYFLSVVAAAPAYAHLEDAALIKTFNDAIEMRGKAILSDVRARLRDVAGKVEVKDAPVASKKPKSIGGDRNLTVSKMVSDYTSSGKLPPLTAENVKKLLEHIADA